MRENAVPRFVRLLLFSALASVLLVLGISLFVYQKEMAEGERRVAEFWGKFDPSEYKPGEVLAPQPPIISPHAVEADQATDQILPDELVLGVTVNGSSRAYPINMMTGPSREVFNDQLGGQEIAATW